MKTIRFLCWIWIIGTTMLLLLYAPVSVTSKYMPKGAPTYGDRTTKTEWIGHFKSPKFFFVDDAIGVTRVLKVGSIDFPRLFTAFVLVNGLPALLLWYLSRRRGV
jgi:hypothetical protein